MAIKNVLKKLISLISKRIISAAGLTYLDVPYYPHGMINDIVYYVAALNKIEGDYVEFGTADGTSFINFYNGFRRRKKYLNKFDDMKFWAFDSFEGLSSRTTQDLNSSAQDKTEGLMSCSLDDIKNKQKELLMICKSKTGKCSPLQKGQQ